MMTGYRRSRRLPQLPVTSEWVAGERGFYDLKNAGNGYLLVQIAAITPKRVVVIQVTPDGDKIGKHRSILPASLHRSVPVGGKVVG